MANGRYTLTYYDYGGERSTITIPTAEHDETTLASFDAELDTFKGFLEVLMIDQGTPTEVRAYSTATNKVPSTNPLNQRENKLLVIMETDTTKAPRRLEIPGLDLTKLNPSNRGTVDIGTGPGSDLAGSIEAIYQDPLTGESVTVLEMRHVGRNV